LGFFSKRFWIDWGMPAIAVWMALEFDGFIGSKVDILSLRRVGLTFLLGAVAYLFLTTDADSRWSGCRSLDYLSAEDPEQKPWLPGPGGIVYSDDMTVFYQMFYKNPHADWRYILGYEPGLMPPEDLAIYRNIQRNFHTCKSFEPWVRKMKPEDRLVLRGNPEHKPKIPELEWNYTALGTWAGRLPKK